MTLPVELETSVNQLRAKHTALMDAVNAYRSGTIDASKQELLEMAAALTERLEVEEYTLLGQIARKAKLHPAELAFLRHGPLSLFMQGEQGVWYDPSDLSTLFQDAAGTTPVTADGDPVGLMLDKSGNGTHASQATSAARPIYRTDGMLHWLEFDGVDDRLVFNATLNLATNDFSIAFSGAVLSSGRVFNVGTSNSVFIDAASGRYRIRVFSPDRDLSGSDAPPQDVAVLSAGISQGSTYARYNSQIMRSGPGAHPTIVPTEYGLGARTDGAAAGQIQMYGFVMSQWGSVSAVDALEKYLARKSGVTL